MNDTAGRERLRRLDEQMQGSCRKLASAMTLEEESKNLDTTPPV